MATATIMSYMEIFQEFSPLSPLTYIIFPAVFVTINSTVIYLFITRKSLRNKASNIMLFSLAFSDLGYEAFVTPLFLGCDFDVETRRSETCTVLYYVYVVFNISTVLHFLLEIFRRFLDSFYSNTLTSRRSILPPHAIVVGLSLSAWCCSFVLAFLCSTSTIDILDKRALVLLGYFKASGYLGFGAISFAMPIIIWGIRNLVMEKQKPRGKSDTTIDIRMGSGYGMTEQKRINSASSVERWEQRDQKDGLGLCYMFLLVYLLWIVWFVIEVDSKLMMSVEMMKCFEISRLGARMFNPLLNTFMQRDFKLALKTLKETWT